MAITPMRGGIPYGPQDPSKELDDVMNVELPDEDTTESVVENADGSADLIEPEEEASDIQDFDENLAESLPEDEMHKVALDLLRKIERDKESRKRRDEQYEEGIRRTGM